MLNSTRLARKTAAFYRGNHVELVFHAGNLKWLAQDHLQHGACKIRVQFFAVHNNLARAWFDPDTSNRVFTLACSIGAAECVTHGLTRFCHNSSCGGCVARYGAQLFE